MCVRVNTNTSKALCCSGSEYYSLFVTRERRKSREKTTTTTTTTLYLLLRRHERLAVQRLVPRRRGKVTTTALESVAKRRHVDFMTSNLDARSLGCLYALRDEDSRRRAHAYIKKKMTTTRTTTRTFIINPTTFARLEMTCVLYSTVVCSTNYMRLWCIDILKRRARLFMSRWT